MLERADPSFRPDHNAMPGAQESRAATYEHIMYKEAKFPSWMSEEARRFIGLALCKVCRGAGRGQAAWRCRCDPDGVQGAAETARYSQPPGLYIKCCLNPEVLIDLYVPATPTQHSPTCPMLPFPSLPLPPASYTPPTQNASQRPTIADLLTHAWVQPYLVRHPPGVAGSTGTAGPSRLRNSVSMAIHDTTSGAVPAASSASSQPAQPARASSVSVHSASQPLTGSGMTPAPPAGAASVTSSLMGAGGGGGVGARVVVQLPGQPPVQRSSSHMVADSSSPKHAAGGGGASPGVGTLARSPQPHSHAHGAAGSPAMGAVAGGLGHGSGLGGGHGGAGGGQPYGAGTHSLNTSTSLKVAVPPGSQVGVLRRAPDSNAWRCQACLLFVQPVPALRTRPTFLPRVYIAAAVQTACTPLPVPKHRPRLPSLPLLILQDPITGSESRLHDSISDPTIRSFEPTPPPPHHLMPSQPPGAVSSAALMPASRSGGGAPHGGGADGLERAHSGLGGLVGSGSSAYVLGGARTPAALVGASGGSRMGDGGWGMGMGRGEGITCSEWG